MASNPPSYTPAESSRLSPSYLQPLIPNMTSDPPRPPYTPTRVPYSYIPDRLDTMSDREAYANGMGKLSQRIAEYGDMAWGNMTVSYMSRRQILAGTHPLWPPHRSEEPSSLPFLHEGIYENAHRIQEQERLHAAASIRESRNGTRRLDALREGSVMDVGEGCTRQEVIGSGRQLRPQGIADAQDSRSRLSDVGRRVVDRPLDPPLSPDRSRPLEHRARSSSFSSTASTLVASRTDVGMVAASREREQWDRRGRNVVGDADSGDGEDEDAKGGDGRDYRIEE